MTDAIKEGTRGLNESLETIAKKHGFKYTSLAYGAKMKHPTKGEIDINRYGEWHHKGTNKTGDSEEMFSSLDKHLSTVKEEAEQVAEVLTKSMGAGEWIKDFVKSKNPKFAGKSKEKRKEMALGAFYSKEETESVDEGMFSPPKMITGTAAKTRAEFLRGWHDRHTAVREKF